MINSKTYAAQSASSPLAAFEIQRRDPGPEDVQIEILYCGVCHSDLHTARNEWKNTLYPSVPGHEIVGRVVAVGRTVHRANSTPEPSPPPVPVSPANENP